MPAIRKDSTEISLAELVAQMPDGCRARREWEAIQRVLSAANMFWTADSFEGCCFAYSLMSKALAAYKEVVK